MTQLKPVFEHTVTLPATQAASEDAAEVVRTRLVGLLVQFAKSPDRLIGGLKCRRVLQNMTDTGILILERELEVGKTTFCDTVTVTDRSVLFSVSPSGELKASTFRITIEGGVQGDFVLRFQYEEDGQVVWPEQLLKLRTKAWKAKDLDIAAWCGRHLGF